MQSGIVHVTAPEPHPCKAAERPPGMAHEFGQLRTGDLRVLDRLDQAPRHPSFRERDDLALPGRIRQDLGQRPQVDTRCDLDDQRESLAVAGAHQNVEAREQDPVQVSNQRSQVRMPLLVGHSEAVLNDGCEVRAGELATQRLRNSRLARAEGLAAHEGDRKGRGRPATIEKQLERGGFGLGQEFDVLRGRLRQQA